MPYKVKFRSVALALASYWTRRGVPCVARFGIAGKWEVSPAVEYPALWEEICEAFVAGRISVMY